MAAVLLLTACGPEKEQAAKAGTKPSPSASPSPKPPNPYAKKVPTFGARPVAEKVQLPAGNSALWVQGRLPINQPVAFITIDDGWIQRPEAIRLFEAANIPVSLFLVSSVASSNPKYFKAFRDRGAGIENHTVDHISLSGLSYERQRWQICHANDEIEKSIGVRPKLFRPPFGNYDQTTLRAAHDCGIKAAFYWTQTVNGGKVFYQGPPNKVEAGDVILMHFREAFVADFLAALRAIHDAGLTPALLEDYIP